MSAQLSRTIFVWLCPSCGFTTNEPKHGDNYDEYDPATDSYAQGYLCQTHCGEYPHDWTCEQPVTGPYTAAVCEEER